MNNREYLDEVLDDMNNCVSPCVDIPQTCPPRAGKTVDINWLVENLPGALPIVIASEEEEES